MPVLYKPQIILETKKRTDTYPLEVALKHFQRGNDLYCNGEYKQALKEYEAALQAAPDFASVHVNIGAAQARLGNNDLALENLDKPVALQPDLAEPLYNRRATLVRKRDYREALIAFD
ncbi:MAG: tetratricopeptide repeat protein [Dehalococcoidia bacterium]|nr:tetratricopeptide repeat protein [Dehalococcoidia bacterium]